MHEVCKVLPPAGALDLCTRYVKFYLRLALWTAGFWLKAKHLSSSLLPHIEARCRAWTYKLPPSAVDVHVSPWLSQEPPISVQKLQVSFAVLLGGASSWDRLLLQLQRQDVDWHDRFLHLLVRHRPMR